MPLGDVFKRKDKEKEKEKRPEIPASSPSNPEFAFHRPTSPPPDYTTNTNNAPTSPSTPPEPRRNRLSLSPFSRPRANSATSSASASSLDPDRSHRRLSARLHLRREVS